MACVIAKSASAAQGLLQSDVTGRARPGGVDVRSGRGIQRGRGSRAGLGQELTAADGLVLLADCGSR